jgi:uncharacterized damage-inducible protein DinB
MTKHAIVLLYDYNYWANTRVLDAATRVSPERFSAPAGLSHGSLRGTLAHILGTEVIWRLRWQEGLSVTALPAEDEFPTLEVIRTRWAAEERAMREYLATVSDEALSQKMQYKTTKGVPRENVLWHVLVHVVNHGTQFRSEAGVILTQYGQSPGDVDLLAFLRERAM